MEKNHKNVVITLRGLVHKKDQDLIYEKSRNLIHKKDHSQTSL